MCVILQRWSVLCSYTFKPLLGLQAYSVGNYNKCGDPETGKHIIFECDAYERERLQLIQELGWLGTDNVSLKLLLGNG